MSAPRIFVDASCAPGTKIQLDPDDTRHLARVLRMKSGEDIIVVSGRIAWHAVLEEVASDRATATIIAAHERPSSELPVAVAVLQAVPKGTKMDDVVEKVVELGATRIVPIRCARSYGGDSRLKLERWRRIARTAAQQSQRLVVPEVENSLSFHDAIDRWVATSKVILAHERAERGSLAAALADDAHRPVSIVVGPEGSFTDDELCHARDADCAFASLGPTVLRSETAAAAMLAAIAAMRGWW